MTSIVPIIITGRLVRAEAVQTHDLAQLSLTLELPASAQGGAPTTVECLMACGRGAAGWRVAQHAYDGLQMGKPYRAAGADLRLAGTQLWLLGLQRITALPDDALPPAVDLQRLLGARAASLQADAADADRAMGARVAA